MAMTVAELLVKIVADTSGVGKSIDDTVKKSKESGTKLEGVFGKVGAAVAGAFTAKKIAEFGVECVKVAANAETAFAKVTTLLSNGTDNTAYFNSIKKASSETGVAIADFSEAVYQAISASVDQAKAVAFTTQAVKLAKGGFTDTATAVDVLTTAINAYGLKADDATDISNKLITTQNLGKVTVGELASVMGRSIPTARAYNVGLNTLCGTYAIMTKNGNPAAESTTLLNAMLNELGKSGTKVSDILKNQTGQSFSALMNSGYSLTDVLQILQDEADRAGLSLGDLFGSAEAAKGATILINNAEDLNNAIAAMGDSAGATESAYSKVMDTLSEKTTKLKNNWELLKESIGAVALPAVSGVVDWLNSGFDKVFGKNDFKGQASSLEEATQKAQEYGNQIDAIYAKYDAGEEITASDMYRINQLTGAMNDYLVQVEAFKSGTAEMAGAAADPAQKFENATNQYVSSAEELMAKFQATYEGISEKVSGWFGPFEKATTSVKTSVQDIMSNMQSQIDFNNQYVSNIQYLKDAGLGNLSQALQAYGKDGSAYASAIVSALEAAGGATTEEGQRITAQFQELMAGVDESQSALAAGLTTMSGEFDSQMQEIVSNYADSIQDLDKSGEAITASTNTMNSFVTGLKTGSKNAITAISGIGAQMTSALQAALGTVTMHVNIVANGSSGAGGSRMVAFGHKDGLDYVPYDEYPARLHKGEAVLTAAEARVWRAGKRSGATDAAPLQHGSGKSGGMTVIQYIQAIPQSPAELAAATEAYLTQARWT